jgi:hypothetical protein
MAVGRELGPDAFVTVPVTVAPAVAPGAPGVPDTPVIVEGEVGEPPPQPTANRVQARPRARTLRIGSSAMNELESVEPRAHSADAGEVQRGGEQDADRPSTPGGGVVSHRKIRGFAALGAIRGTDGLGQA